MKTCWGCSRLSTKECSSCGTLEARGTFTLKCPTCVEQGLEAAYFCCQSCFGSSWVLHKEIHRSKKKEKVIDEMAKFENFNFTGSLRPYPYGPKRTFKDDIGRPDYASTGVPRGEIVAQTKRGIPVIQTAEDIKCLKDACNLARRVLDVVGTFVVSASNENIVTGDMIDEEVHKFCIENDCYPSPLNYYEFPRSVCVSVNEVICHGIPDTRPFSPGDIVNIDITVYHKGFHADLNESFLVPATIGEDITEELWNDSVRLLDGAYQSLMYAIKSLKKGGMYRQIGTDIQRTAERYGLSVNKTYCGHGIGKLFHCAPTIPHYKGNKAVGVIEPGHVFTIEPMLCLVSPVDITWPDKWTAVTKDGKRSAQFEHTILVTKTGVEVLTERTANSAPIYPGWDGISLK